MLAGSALFVIASLLVLGLLLRPLTNRLHLPFEALLLVLGFAFGSLYINAHSLGIQPDVLRTLVFYVVLPVLIFSTAYSINTPQLRRNLISLLILAVPVALISLVLSSVLIYYGIGQPSSFPWLAALITGTMLMATDNRALRHTFAHLNLPDELRVLINGEDLLNNASSIVLFTLLLAFTSQSALSPTPGEIAEFLIWNVLGGTFIGLVLGFAALVFLRMRQFETIERAILTLLVAYLAYLVADQLLKSSGVLSVLVAALIMGRTMHEDLDAAHDDFVDEFWHLNASLSGYLLYLILGLLITLDLFTERWLAVLIGAGAIVLARIVGLAVIMPILIQRHSHLIDVAHHNILFFTGTRGAVALGLALSVPTHLEYYRTIEAIGFGVVLLTLLAQAPFLELFLRRKKAERGDL